MSKKNVFQALSVFLLVLIVGVMFAACNKADPETDFSFEPSGDGKGMAITGYKGNNVNVVIPAKIQKIPVVRVGGFSDRKIISVVLPPSVNEIANGAFRGCPNLSTIIIPANVTKIGDNAFNSCPNLSTIIIPANVTEIGRGAFQNCQNLKSVTFKGKSTIIGQAAFNNCRELDKLEFSDGALKPFEFQGERRTERGSLGHISTYTDHYFYNAGRPGRTGGSNQNDYIFFFHSGANAFDNCTKIPTETMSKLQSMGFYSIEEMRELERRAQRGTL